jgi:hypothetical protein
MSYFREVLTDFDERVYPGCKENFKLVQYTTSKGLVVTEEVTNAEVAEEAAEVVGKTKKVKKERITFFK